MFTGWRRAPQGVASHPLYRLATQVQRGKLTLAAAIARIDATSELRDLADSQLVELDRQIGELSSSNRHLAHTLASLNYAVARAKGFRRVQVDCALRLSELTYDTPTRLNLLHEALTASQKSGYRRGEKIAQATLGKLYTQENRPEEAIAAYRDQLEAAKSGGYAAIDVESLLALGDLYRGQNQLDEALETFERTVNAAGAAGQPTGQIEALTRAAEIYFLRGTPTAALDALDRALVIAVELKDERVEAELASLYGDLLRELRRYGEAATAYQRALTLTGEDVRRQTDILGRLVPLCIDLGAWQDGADYARQGLLLAAGTEPAQETLWLLDLAIALLELGRPLEAVDTARDGLAMAQAADPGGRLEHDALGRLGALLTETGDWAEAADALHKALTLSARLGDNAAEATWMTQLARCAWYAGDLSEAIQRYTDALTMARDLNDRSLEAHILGSLGTLLRESGQARRGLEYYDEALELSKLAGDGREVVRYLTLLGRTYGELRHHDDAKRSLLEAISLARKLDDKRGQVEAHRRYAALLRGRRDREGAIAQISAAAALVGALDDPRLVTTTVQELAAIQEELGQWEESAASYRRLLSNAERSDDLSGKLQAHLQLGRLLQFQQPSESRQHLRQALDIAHEMNDPQLIDQVSGLLPTGTEDASSPLAD